MSAVWVYVRPHALAEWSTATRCLVVSGVDSAGWIHVRLPDARIVSLRASECRSEADWRGEQLREYAEQRAFYGEYEDAAASMLSAACEFENTAKAALALALATTYEKQARGEPLTSPL